MPRGHVLRNPYFPLSKGLEKDSPRANAGKRELGETAKAVSEGTSEGTEGSYRY